ncbi:MAG: hypothetical protein PWP03_795 [Candidatus Woesearchaeota archaeon]|nr:hypothetical protein [Candidatus Woesearchaeota archaeon]
MIPKNKKGLAFNVFIAVFGIIALSIALYSFSTQDPEHELGEPVAKMLRFYSDSERLKNYLDDAVRLEANNLTFKFAEKGGILEDCFIYRNKTLWTQRNKKCFTLEKLNQSFNNLLNKNLKERYKEYPFEFFDFDYDFIFDNDVLIGKPQSDLKIVRTTSFPEYLSLEKVKVPQAFTNVSDLEIPSTLFIQFLRLNFCDLASFSVGNEVYINRASSVSINRTYNPDDFKFYITSYNSDKRCIYLDYKGNNSLYPSPFFNHVPTVSEKIKFCGLTLIYDSGVLKICDDEKNRIIETRVDVPKTQLFVNPIVNIDLGLDYLEVYENISKVLNELKSICGSKKDVENCVEDNKEIFEKYNLNVVDLQSNKEKAFYDFVDDIMMCEQSDDKTCACNFRKVNKDNDLSVMWFSSLPNEGSFLKSSFDGFNGDYKQAFFSFSDVNSFAFAYNLNKSGLMNTPNCAVNPLVEPFLYLRFFDEFSLKTYRGFDFPLNYEDKIKVITVGDSNLINNVETNLDHSLIKTFNGKVCLVDPEVPESIATIYYFLYANYIGEKIRNPTDPDIEEKILNPLQKFYDNNFGKFSKFNFLNFCDILKNYNFDYETLFPECNSLFDENSKLLPSIERHVIFDTFKEDLQKLKKKKCNVERHYFRFDLEYNNYVFNYKTFKFEKPVFSFSAYI